MTSVLLLLAASCVGDTTFPGQVTTYEWRTYPDCNHMVALYRDGVQVGAYSYSTSKYRPVDHKTRQWGEPCPCPAVPPLLDKRLVPIAPPGVPYSIRF